MFPNRVRATSSSSSGFVRPQAAAAITSTIRGSPFRAATSSRSTACTSTLARPAIVVCTTDVSPSDGSTWAM